MSLIKEFERRLETILEGFFTRQFRSGLQPIEIAKKLAREMDDNRRLSVSRTYVPNAYTVLVGQADAEKLLPFSAKLCEEFADFLIAHAQRESCTIMGRPIVVIEALNDLRLGEFRVRSAWTEPIEAPPAPKPQVKSQRSPVEPPIDGTRVMQAIVQTSWVELTDSGKRFSIMDGRTTIGRAASNTIILPDQSISRIHAEVLSAQGKSVLKDVNSRNGTFVNGRRITEHTLKDGDTIKVGMTNLRFRGKLSV
ncbi:MAG: DUF3662 and FHA domain-containing protein [Chloroflexi bacterium]|nr:DUF3662 and FHA domain-containing protein [Chloroflexota bacterium]